MGRKTLGERPDVQFDTVSSACFLHHWLGKNTREPKIAIPITIAQRKRPLSNLMLLRNEDSISAILPTDFFSLSHLKKKECSLSFWSVIKSILDVCPRNRYGAGQQQPNEVCTLQSKGSGHNVETG